MNFKQWLEQEETNGANNPLTDISSAVLFGDEHGNRVVVSGDNDPAITTAQQLSGAIWFEGTEIKPVVQTFIDYYSLANFNGQPRQQSSWEPNVPQKMTQEKFKQGNLLASIFGGNNEQGKAQDMLGHPFVKQLLTTRGNATILDVLKASSISVNKEVGQVRDAGIVDKYLDRNPNGWENWSHELISKQAIQQLLQLVANEPKLRVFNQMLYQSADERSLTNFIKIGRQWGFNKPGGAFGNLQSQINYERDMRIIDLMKNKGGIFFAGSDHVGNIRKLLQNKGVGSG